MPAVPVDLSISSRWILPMTSRETLLENHTLLVRDGRIVDLLPSDLAPHRYDAAVRMERPGHVLMPGLVDTRASIVPGVGRAAEPDHVRDSALLGVAALLRGGTTSFCSVGFFPEECARAAVALGTRALIGLPVAEHASPWARGPAEHMTRAVRLRDEFTGHPSVATAFAPLSTSVMSDATLDRIATLVNELDAGVLVSLHESPEEIDRCLRRHAVRPIERLHARGLLTPALNAAAMVHVTEADVAMAQQSGIAIALCPEAGMHAGFGVPPVGIWLRSGLRVGVGTGVRDDGVSDLWSEIKMSMLLSCAPGGAGSDAWDALALATRDAAAAVGLDADTGTLETGKWADMCCIDVRSPAMVRAAGVPAAARLVLGGARDNVTDVWVAGRQLLNDGAFTRLDWPELSARVGE